MHPDIIVSVILCYISIYGSNPPAAHQSETSSTLVRTLEQRGTTPCRADSSLVSNVASLCMHGALHTALCSASAS